MTLATDTHTSLKAMRTAPMKPNSPAGDNPQKRRTSQPKVDLPHQRWSHRYLAYRLISRYTNLNYPAEQRELARLESQQLQDRFKFDLAMYAAHAQLSPKDKQLYANPTLFGDDVLRLIKLVVVGRGRLNYRRLTQLFMEKTAAVSYRKFKENLLTYLGFYDRAGDWTDLLRQQFQARLLALYPARDRAIVDDALIFRTCNRAIELLTTEDGQKPSPIFTAKIACGMPLFLTIALLKLALICPKTKLHLERCISSLILYYEQFPERECQSVIQFLEIFKIVFAIYDDDVEYSLVKIESLKAQSTEDEGVLDLDNYRIFARLKTEKSG
ncbi:MAG TPA: hypothetical protein IGS17_04500 [Oscillatoriales cyanobacterium M59_W2019_021]|nr:hypothetical protein [Oscillatoriales cyanobacterium M4454_W2019_049]HIK50177.1 hypothetical protein [Oscillatoriales cyanobacterium M59_W2019_021]